MFKKFGIPTLAVIAMLAFVGAAPAKAGVQFGVGVAPVAPAPYVAPYPYDPYAYPYDYYGPDYYYYATPYVYPYSWGGSWGGRAWDRGYGGFRGGGEFHGGGGGFHGGAGGLHGGGGGFHGGGGHGGRR